MHVTCQSDIGTLVVCPPLHQRYFPPDYDIDFDDHHQDDGDGDDDDGEKNHIDFGDGDKGGFQKQVP